MADENVVTEEVGVGTISGGGSSGFDVGQFLLQSNKPVVPLDSLNVSTPIVTETEPVQLSEDFQGSSHRVSPSLKDFAVNTGQASPQVSSPSMNDLKLVSDVLSGGACADADEIARVTGLSRENVIYCIEWLVQQGLVAQDSTRYCGLSAVKKMCDQLKVCKECFKI